MHIVLAGAGALGRAMGALLCAGGGEVTLFVRAHTVPALVEPGRLRLTGLADTTVPTALGPGRTGVLGVTADAGLLPEGCGVVFATKGPQLADCARTVHEQMRGAHREPGWVAGLQNGVVKDDVLSGEFGPNRLVRMVSTLNARLDAPEVIVVSGWGNTFVGADGDDSAGALLVAVLSRTGVAATRVSIRDAETVTWMKCVNAAGVFGVTALTRLPTGLAFTAPMLVRAYLDLALDAASIARAHGIVAADFDGLPMHTRLADPESTVTEMVTGSRTALTAPASYSSMAEDVRAGRPTEVEEVFGDLVHRAAAADLAVPHLALVHRLIAGQTALAASDNPPSNTTAAPVMNEHSGDTR